MRQMHSDLMRPPRYGHNLQKRMTAVRGYRLIFCERIFSVIAHASFHAVNPCNRRIDFSAFLIRFTRDNGIIHFFDGIFFNLFAKLMSGIFIFCNYHNSRCFSVQTVDGSENEIFVSVIIADTVCKRIGIMSPRRVRGNTARLIHRQNILVLIQYVYIHVCRNYFARLIKKFKRKPIALRKLTAHRNILAVYRYTARIFKSRNGGSG